MTAKHSSKALVTYIIGEGICIGLLCIFAGLHHHYYQVLHLK